MTLNVGYALSSLILISVFLLTLVTQLTGRYNPLLYWIVILSTSTAGTTMSDFMDRTLGLGYATGSMILIAIPAGDLRGLAPERRFAERQQGANLPRRDVLLDGDSVSNTLGTALGDYLADDSGLGFAGGALARPLPWWWRSNTSRRFRRWCCSGWRSC
jgi:uncharacterized membrane-anchored protein